MSSDEDDNIWEYRSQTKRLKLSQNNKCHVPKSDSSKDRIPPRKQAKKSSRKDSYDNFESLPLPPTSSSRNESKLEDNQDDFKTSKIYTQIIKKETIINKSARIKPDPDHCSSAEGKTKSRQARTRKKKAKQEGHATPNDKIRSGRCRVCQFPFSGLSRIETPTWHEETCLEIPYSSNEQCLFGVQCTNTIYSHFKKFRHTALSRSQDKSQQDRPLALDGDITNAKMKLQFDDNPCTAVEVPDTDDSFIVLDTSHNTHDSTVSMDTKLKQNNEVLPSKRKSDHLKKVSVLTLMKQMRKEKKGHTLSTEGSATFTRINPELETKADSATNMGSKLDASSSLFSKVKCDDSVSINMENNDSAGKGGHSSRICVKDITQKGDTSTKLNTDNEDNNSEVFTVVNSVDLMHSESSNSVQDIDNITDNSRSITEMLKDVFGDTESEKENPGKQETDNPVTIDDILESDSSSNDTDILLTTISTAESIKYKSAKPKHKQCKKNKSNDKLDNHKDSVLINEDLSFSNTITGPVTSVSVSTHINSNSVTRKSKISTPSVTEVFDESNSCSRDSAKGFFARKLEESKLRKHNTVSFGKLSKGFSVEKDFREAAEEDKTDTEREKSTCPGKSASPTVSEIHQNNKASLKKFVPVKKQEMDAIHDNDDALTRDKHTSKPQTTNKSRKKVSSKKKKDQFLKKEIEKMELAGLGKITVETDSSDSESETGNITMSKVMSGYTESKDSTDLTQTSKIKKELDVKAKHKLIDVKKEELKSVPNEVKTKLLSEGTGDDTKTMKSSQTQTTDAVISSSVNSQHTGSTPRFTIMDVRTVEEDINLSGGFFREEAVVTIDDDIDAFNVTDNLSECEEDIDETERLIYSGVKQNGSIVRQHCSNDTQSSEQHSQNRSYTSLDTQSCSMTSKDASYQEDSYNDESSVLDSVADKVKEIQRNALEILMQTSKALQHRNKSKTIFVNQPQSVLPKKQLSVNDVLMSKRNKQPQTVKLKQKVDVPKQDITTEEKETSVSSQRKCPFYKKIPGTSFTVDAFRYGIIPDCKAYILTHFHYDHYGGLAKSFKQQLYCSEITGNLVKKKIGVSPQFINTISMNTPTIIEGVEITFLEANHCPGAVLVLFKLKSGQVFLHTGDFRACEEMESYAELQKLKIHALYLDTTYCDPQYDFPHQKEVVSYAIKLATDAVTRNPGTLIVCGSYTIGKERIFRGIAEKLDCKICVARDKKSVIDCLQDEWLQRRTSLVWGDSQLHVLPMGKLNFMGLKEHLEKNGKNYSAVLGIKPTGWTYSKKLVSLDHIKPEVNKEDVKVYGLPYSEHSSFLELKRFVKFTKPDKILPTVNNGNYHSRKKMEAIFESWMAELRQGTSTSYVQPSLSRWTC